MTPRICTVVCRTQGDRPLLSKVSVAREGSGERPCLSHPSPTLPPFDGGGCPGLSLGERHKFACGC